MRWYGMERIATFIAQRRFLRAALYRQARGSENTTQARETRKPGCIRREGPNEQVWTLQFEARRLLFAAGSVTCFRGVSELAVPARGADATDGANPLQKVIMLLTGLQGKAALRGGGAGRCDCRWLGRQDVPGNGHSRSAEQT